MLVFAHSMLVPCMRIGHRGACGYAAENTLASFAKALELDVDMVELDVYCCASDELVVIHDATLKRTTNGDGDVEQWTISQLKELDAGNGQKIPTLAEVCDYINRRVIINIELKGHNTGPAVVQLIEHYVHARGWSYDDFLVSSFNHRQIFEVKNLNSVIRTSALLNGIPTTLAAFAIACNTNAIGISKDCITQEYVDHAHHLGLKVYVFTVNEPHDIKYITQLGVDGIISNYPDRILSEHFYNIFPSCLIKIHDRSREFRNHVPHALKVVRR
jgi:glycerophosphoryl diester phosphodiesterase